MEAASKLGLDHIPSDCLCKPTTCATAPKIKPQELTRKLSNLDISKAEESKSFWNSDVTEHSSANVVPAISSNFDYNSTNEKNCPKCHYPIFHDNNFDKSTWCIACWFNCSTLNEPFGNRIGVQILHVSSELEILLCSLLSLSPMRPLAREMLSCSYFFGLDRNGSYQPYVTESAVPSFLTSWRSPFNSVFLNQSLQSDEPVSQRIHSENTCNDSFISVSGAAKMDSEVKTELSEWSWQEIFYLWKRAGGNILFELERHGSFDANYRTIELLPKIIRLENVVSSTRFLTSTRVRYESDIIGISLAWLEPYLVIDANQAIISESELLYEGASDPTESFEFPSSHEDSMNFLVRIFRRIRQALPSYPASRNRIIHTSLPIASYLNDSKQFSRHKKSGLISSVYPISSLYECWNPFDRNLPTFIRKFLWSVCLNIPGNYSETYSSLEFQREQPHIMDAQLDVDIPRCHQYHPLLSTFHGQLSLRRIIKTWILNNPKLCYWQGLDSIAAPLFVTVYPDEALAFALLQEVIMLYVNKYFVEENNMFLNVSLTIFSQVYYRLLYWLIV